MKYPDLLDATFPLFPLHCSVAMIVSLFLICRAIKEKKWPDNYICLLHSGCVYLFGTKFWMLPPQQQNCPVSLSSSFPRHRTDVNNRTAGCCPVGPYVFIGLDQHYVSLISFVNQNVKTKCVFSVLFKQGLVSEHAVWTAELGPVLTKTSGNTQPLVLCSFLKDTKLCLSHMPVPCMSCLGILLKNNMLDEQIPFDLVWHISNWFQANSHNMI